MTSPCSVAFLSLFSLPPKAFPINPKFQELNAKNRQVTGATRVLAMGGGGVSLKEAELSEHQDSCGDSVVDLDELSMPQVIF